MTASVITLDTSRTSYTEALSVLEATYLKDLMESTKYNQSKTAKIMGLSRGTLRTKLREHFGTAYFRDAE